MPEMLTSRIGVQPIGGTMAFSLRPVRLSGMQTVLKRIFDLAVAGIALLLLAPLMMMITILVKLTSKGPVLFGQQRVTKGGRTFTMHKFRTMRQSTSDILEERGLDPSSAFFKMSEDDPLITKVGRVLRRFSLDELPQLFDVLRGDMSLVGPRPLPAAQVASNLELLEMRHEVPAGMTGWWQIQGRSDIEAVQAVRLDVFYIENWSLALDLYILMKTAGVVLLQRGAR
jgi:lipopolysaccharide/colanic/teichoic acid biosynthesis glycosyltransferase